MNKLLAVLVAFAFAFGNVGVMAADSPVATAPMKKLEKPAGVTAEAWAKMTDAEKQKAVDKAKTAASRDAPAKKEKKGGC
jgi:hypothetical protein